MCVCVCVCVCMCTCTCMHVCVCMHLHASLLIRTGTEMTASLFAHCLLMSVFLFVFSGCDVNLCEPIGNVTPLHVATNMHSDISLFRPMLQLLLRGRCILNWRAFSTLETPLYRSLGLEKVNHYGYVYMCIVCVFVCLLWLVCVCVCDSCVLLLACFSVGKIPQFLQQRCFWIYRSLGLENVNHYGYVYIYVCLFLPASCGCFYFGVTVVSFVVGLFLSGQDTIKSALQGAPGYIILHSLGLQKVNHYGYMCACICVFVCCWFLLLLFLV